MNEFKVILSNSAKKDLENIIEYTYDTWGEEQVEIYRQKIQTGIAEISNNAYPQLIRERNDIFEGLKLYKVEKHYLCFSTVGSTLFIGRFLHEKMDIGKNIHDSKFQD